MCTQIHVLYVHLHVHSHSSPPPPTHTHIHVPLQRSTVTQLKSFKEVEYEAEGVYIFLRVSAYGPLLYHIYVWVGASVRGAALEEAFQHAQNLAHCLPGNAVMYREVSQVYNRYRYIYIYILYLIYSQCVHDPLNILPYSTVVIQRCVGGR